MIWGICGDAWGADRRHGRAVGKTVREDTVVDPRTAADRGGTEARALRASAPARRRRAWPRCSRRAPSARRASSATSSSSGSCRATAVTRTSSACSPTRRRSSACSTTRTWCRSYDFGEDDGILFLALEYVEGPSLSRVLRTLRAANRRMPPAIAAYIGARDLPRARLRSPAGRREAARGSTSFIATSRRRTSMLTPCGRGEAARLRRRHLHAAPRRSTRSRDGEGKAGLSRARAAGGQDRSTGGSICSRSAS